MHSAHTHPIWTPDGQLLAKDLPFMAPLASGLCKVANAYCRYVDLIPQHINWGGERLRRFLTFLRSTWKTFLVMMLVRRRQKAEKMEMEPEMETKVMEIEEDDVSPE